MAHEELEYVYGSTSYALSNGNQTATYNDAAGTGFYSVGHKTGGKWYFEWSCDTVSSDNHILMAVGFSDRQVDVASGGNNAAFALLNNDFSANGHIFQRVAGSSIDTSSRVGNVTNGGWLAGYVDLTTPAAAKVWLLTSGSGGGWNGVAGDPVAGTGGVPCDFSAGCYLLGYGQAGDVATLRSLTAQMTRTILPGFTPWSDPLVAGGAAGMTMIF